MKKIDISKIALSKLAELQLEESVEGRFINHDIYPFTIDIKPTKFHQRCSVCNKDLEKGERRVRLIRGMSRRGYFQYAYYHFDCFLAVFYQRIHDVSKRYSVWIMDYPRLKEREILREAVEKCKGTFSLKWKEGYSYRGIHFESVENHNKFVEILRERFGIKRNKRK